MIKIMKTLVIKIINITIQNTEKCKKSATSDGNTNTCSNRNVKRNKETISKRIVDLTTTTTTAKLITVMITQRKWH